MRAIRSAHAAQFAIRFARSDAHMPRIFARARADAQLDFGPTTGALCEKFSAPVPVYQVRREHGRGPGLVAGLGIAL